MILGLNLAGFYVRAHKNRHEMNEEERLSTPFQVQREDTLVMFMRAKDDTATAIQEAWAEFERAVGLKGRKFFGTFDKETSEYRVCAQVKEGDNPTAHGFEVATIPGGAYLCTRLQGEPPAIYTKIRPAFEKMVTKAAVDSSRPSIEFYKSRDVIDLLLPIA